MRITFILPIADFTGGNRVVASHAGELARRGHRVVVVSRPAARLKLTKQLRRLVKGDDWRQPVSRGSHLDGINVEHIRLDTSRRVVDGDVPDADVVVATWWETAEWVADLSPRKGAKAYFLQGLESSKDGQPVERVEATWRLPMHKIVVAGWLVDVARERFSDSNASLVPNSVDATRFAVPERGKQPVPTVGFINSGLSRNKGGDIVLAALREAKRQLPALQGVCFGFQPPPAAQPLPPWVDVYVGPDQSQIPGLYGRCDAFLHGSRVEGFGLPILEAMACHTPVVATPAGAAPELIAKGGGRLVVREDALGMAAALVDICALSDPEWRALSQAARQTATSYSWEEAGGLMEEALVRAAAQPLT